MINGRPRKKARGHPTSTSPFQPGSTQNGLGSIDRSKKPQGYRAATRQADAKINHVSVPLHRDDVAQLVDALAMALLYRDHPTLGKALKGTSCRRGRTSQPRSECRRIHRLSSQVDYHVAAQIAPQ